MWRIISTNTIIINLYNVQSIHLPIEEIFPRDVGVDVPTMTGGKISAEIGINTFYDISNQMVTESHEYHSAMST